MAILSKLIRAAFGAAFLKGMIKDVLGPAIVAYLMGSGRRRLPGYLKMMLEGAVALTMLRSMKWRWIMQPAVVSALIAILGALMKQKEGRSNHRRGPIDFDDYRVVEEK